MSTLPPTDQPAAATSAATAQGGKADWSTRPERGSPALLRAMAWVALNFGRRFARMLLYPIAFYFFLFGGEARTASREYLARVLPHTPTWRDGFSHVFAFASATLDRVYFLNGRYELFDMHVHGAEVTEFGEPPGLFMMGAHIGSFESIRAIGHQTPHVTVALLMYEENARKISSLMAAINPKAAQEIIALGRVDSMLHLRDRLDQGVVIGILADRTLADDETIEVELLGSKVGLPAGPFRIAAILRRPVLLMLGLYSGPNRYDVHFERIFDFSQTKLPRGEAVRTAAERYAGRLEHFCKLYPYNWFNFYDFWKQ